MKILPAKRGETFLIRTLEDKRVFMHYVGSNPEKMTDMQFEFKVGFINACEFEDLKSAQYIIEAVRGSGYLEIVDVMDLAESFTKNQSS